MKKLCVLCVLLVLLLSFTSCGFFGEQNYFCEINDVKSIQIVVLDKYIEEEYIYDYTILVQISDCANFVERLNQLDHSINWGDPRVMQLQFVVIRIEYHNGDYDMIHSDAQSFYRSGKNNTGYFLFDDEQFNTLISDYMVR